MTGFKLRSEITNVEVIASGRKLRIMGLLRKLYGKGRWRKLKGRALVDYQRVRLFWLSSIGTRPTGSDA